MVEILLIYDPVADGNVEYKQQIDTISQMDEFANLIFKTAIPSNSDIQQDMIKYNVTSIPTILIKHDGELLYKLIGNAPQRDIVRLIEISLEKITNTK